MFPHDVSNMPIILRTPSRMSRITAGGILNALISDSVSGLMLPTARLAS